jgi:hypothetical protein
MSKEDTHYLDGACGDCLHEEARQRKEEEERQKEETDFCSLWRQVSEGMLLLYDSTTGLVTCVSPTVTFSLSFWIRHSLYVALIGS